MSPSTPARRRARPTSRSRRRRARPRRLRWFLLTLALVLTAGVTLTLANSYVAFSRVIDARLAGKGERSRPRIFARPITLWRGQAMTAGELVDRLNALGYTERPRVERSGEFAVDDDVVTLVPRGGDLAAETVRVAFLSTEGRDAARPGNRIGTLEAVPGRRAERVTLEPPLLTALMAPGRQKRRVVPLAMIPPRVIKAVLAIEDRRFYDHVGIDPIRMAGALFTNLRGDRPYLVGASTITQQLVKNLFLTPEKTFRRKLSEQFLALTLERRLSKREILELYLNEVYLGQHGSFAIHGVAEAARLFFGKNITNVTVSEAATIAGVIQAPQTYSPFRHPARARARRDLVLQAMGDAEFLSPDAAARAADHPMSTVAHALEDEAPYFIDFVGETLANRYPAWSRSSVSMDVHTTLDLHLQRLAQRAVRDGLSAIGSALNGQQAQAALIASDPRTGEVLALVGGRSYRTSQYNRAVHARRQPGSVFKPFVYLAGFERALLDRRTDFTPATVIRDEPTTFAVDTREWHPGNYGDEYDGPITLRRALARSRNVAAVKVAEMAGYDRLASLWQRIGGSPIDPFPAISLGAFETTPLEMASAYGVLASGGVRRPLHAIATIRVDGRTIDVPAPEARRVARPDLTFLIVHMMRSVLNDGTGTAARARGFWFDAAAKSGTTNDLRDAWFVGFTHELLAVVWVGLDANRSLGLTGSQAALPIWTSFMNGALAGHVNVPFTAPDGISFVEIDRETGDLAHAGCAHTLYEAFLEGTEPRETCRLH